MPVFFFYTTTVSFISEVIRRIWFRVDFCFYLKKNHIGLSISDGKNLQQQRQLEKRKMFAIKKKNKKKTSDDRPHLNQNVCVASLMGFKTSTYEIEMRYSLTIICTHLCTLVYQERHSERERRAKE